MQSASFYVDLPCLLTSATYSGLDMREEELVIMLVINNHCEIYLFLTS